MEPPVASNLSLDGTKHSEQHSPCHRKHGVARCVHPTIIYVFLRKNCLQPSPQRISTQLPVTTMYLITRGRTVVTKGLVFSISTLALTPIQPLIPDPARRETYSMNI